MSRVEKRPAPSDTAPATITPAAERPKTAAGAGGPSKTRRVQNNVRAFSSTQNDRHAFIETFYTYSKMDRSDQVTDLLLSLFFDPANPGAVPPSFGEQMMGSIVELVTRLMSTASVVDDASFVPNVMFHTVNADIMAAMVMRELKVAMVQAQNQQMDNTDNNEIAFSKHLVTTEFNVRSFLARGGLSETHPTITERALAAIGMLREAYDKPTHNLPDIIACAVNSLRNRPTIQQALQLPPPEPRHLFHLTLAAYERYILTYDHGKMHDTYRPCCMRDACCFIRSDQSALVPARNAPLVAWWRPGSRTCIDLTLPPFCILCYTMYINIMSLVGRLRAQDSFFAQVFEVEVGGMDGFPAAYVDMPGMVQRQARHNGYIGPFPRASEVLQNLVRGPAAVSIKIPPPTSTSGSPVSPESPGATEESGKLSIVVPNFS